MGHVCIGKWPIIKLLTEAQAQSHDEHFNWTNEPSFFKSDSWPSHYQSISNIFKCWKLEIKIKNIWNDQHKFDGVPVALVDSIKAY